MEDGELKDAIAEEMAKNKMPISKISVQSGAPTGHSNAYVSGLCQAKKIVIDQSFIKTPEQEVVRKENQVADISEASQQDEQV